MKKQLLICALAATLFACSEGSDLKKSIFVPDADDSKLPAYTEWGYNTFGAYTEGGKVFTFNNNIPLTISAQATCTELRFNGELYEEYGARSDEKRELIIRTMAIANAAGIAPTSAEDLTLINGKTIKLDAASNDEVYVVRNGISHKIEIASGSSITFNRVQKIYIDKNYTQMIVSGHFKIIAKLPNTSFSFTDGRFDVGIKDGYSFFNE